MGQPLRKGVKGLVVIMVPRVGFEAIWHFVS